MSNLGFPIALVGMMALVVTATTITVGLLELIAQLKRIADELEHRNKLASSTTAKERETQ